VLPHRDSRAPKICSLRIRVHSQAVGWPKLPRCPSLPESTRRLLNPTSERTRDGGNRQPSRRPRARLPPERCASRIGRGVPRRTRLSRATFRTTNRRAKGSTQALALCVAATGPTRRTAPPRKGASPAGRRRGRGDPALSPPKPHAAPPASPGAEAGRPARLAPGPAKRDSPILLRFCRRCFRAETSAQRPDQPWPSRRNRRSLRPRPRWAQGPGRGEGRQRRRSGRSQLGL
jgi:hypothetical protein